MAKIAIVSSYSESCGNATYAHVLKEEFGRHMQADVLRLDLFVLQKYGRAFRTLGDRHIREIAEKLKDYDYVNIQCEFGLYGAVPSDSLRRLKILLDAAKNVILTMHRIDLSTSTLDDLYWGRIKYWSPSSWVDAYHRRKGESAYKQLIQYCDKLSKQKNTWVLVHTVRERRLVQSLFRVGRVFDHPITFLTQRERSGLIEGNGRAAFRRRLGLENDDIKIVGAFGFISEYKGFDTLVKALRHLPDNYMLFIFGSQHPQSVKPHVSLDPSLKSVIKTVRKEASAVVNDRVKRLRALGNLTPIDNDVVDDLINFDLFKRVKFIGGLPDNEFVEALRYSDAVVLPYLEVGQSMSGVIALALEADANMFCANNLSFAEYKKYVGDVFENFDIGNYVELAQKIQKPRRDFRTVRDRAFEKYNISTNVQAHLEKFSLRN